MDNLSTIKQHCIRRFVALDGTHLKGFFQQTLLLAAGIDANGQYIIYAWAVVESENKDAWEYFLQHLKLAMPQILECYTPVAIYWLPLTP